MQLLQLFLTPCTFYSTALCSLLLLWSQLLLGGPGIPLTMLSNNSSDFDLTIRQQPDRARVAGGKEKGMSSLLLFTLSLRVDLPARTFQLFLSSLTPSIVKWGWAWTGSGSACWAEQYLGRWKKDWLVDC